MNRPPRPRTLPRPCSAACLACLLLFTGFIGCRQESGSPAPPAIPADGVVVGLIGPGPAHPRWPGVRGGMQRYLDAVPAVRGVFVTPDRDSAEGLLEACKPLFNQRPAACCVFVTDPETARPLVEKLVTSQAAVITIGEPLDDPRVVGHVGVALPAAAELLAEHIRQIVPDRRTYLLVHANGSSDLATRTYERFIMVARRDHARAEFRLLADVNIGGREADAPQLIEELAGRFPHAGLLVTLEPEIWTVARAGWERQLRELNPRFRFATLAAPPTLWARLGTPAEPGLAAALVGPLDGELGYDGLKMAAHVALSRRTPAVQERFVPCELVTAASLPEFAARYAKAAGGLDVSPFLPAPSTQPTNLNPTP